MPLQAAMMHVAAEAERDNEGCYCGLLVSSSISYVSLTASYAAGDGARVGWMWDEWEADRHIGIGGARACPQVDQVFQEEFGTFLLILRVYFVTLRVF